MPAQPHTPISAKRLPKLPPARCGYEIIPDDEIVGGYRIRQPDGTLTPPMPYRRALVALVSLAESADR